MLFYYTGANAIGNIFPDELGDSLSFNAVSLAAAAVGYSFVILTLTNCELVAALRSCRGSRQC